MKLSMTLDVYKQEHSQERVRPSVLSHADNPSTPQEEAGELDRVSVQDT